MILHQNAAALKIYIWVIRTQPPSLNHYQDLTESFNSAIVRTGRLLLHSLVICFALEEHGYQTCRSDRGPFRLTPKRVGVHGRFLIKVVVRWNWKKDRDRCK